MRVPQVKSNIGSIQALRVPGVGAAARQSHTHRSKFAARVQLGPFLGYERPFGSSMFKLLLDGGDITQAQQVMFDDCPRVSE
jgi:hypothetical protein